MTAEENTKKLPIINTIQLDMDGVLADDITSLIEFEGLKSPEGNLISLEEFSVIRKDFRKENPNKDLVIQLINKHLYTRKCFEHYYPTPEFDVFVDLIKHWLRKKKHVEILSSGTEDPGIYSEICRQKIVWLQKRGLHLIPAHFSKGSREKKIWANSSSLLIDDFDRNIKDYKEAGGHGIQHINIDSTISQLIDIGLL